MVMMASPTDRPEFSSTTAWVNRQRSSAPPRQNKFLYLDKLSYLIPSSSLTLLPPGSPRTVSSWPLEPFFLVTTQSVIFDDLCTNFKHHEELDESNALVTITKTQGGKITGASLDISSATVGVVPITVPTSAVDTVRTFTAHVGTCFR